MLRAAMKAMGTDSRSPPTVERIAILRLSMKPSISRPLRSKLGGNAPPKILPARTTPCAIRSQSIGSVATVVKR
ncbi:hypothetical protein QW131_28720 [Roseibium salinum]|nr:hypothetical protein [Roseibium salinum]